MILLQSLDEMDYDALINQGGKDYNWFHGNCPFGGETIGETIFRATIL